MEVEMFFGVYLLVSENPKFKNRTYIGFTVDPNRRIKQHNGGILRGGAWKTSKHGPWKMVLIIHGFPNEISALRFEWAWQNPAKSRRLRNLPKMPKVHNFQKKIAILEEMLLTAPWTRLPLTIRWLSEAHRVEFSLEKAPPVHMPITQGQVQCVKLKPKDTQALTQRLEKCSICKLDIEKQHQVDCLKLECSQKFHILCLDEHCKSTDPNEKYFILPLMVECPNCSQQLLWGEIIRHKNGCYKNSENTDN